MTEDVSQADNGAPKKDSGVIEVTSRKTDRSVSFEKSFGESVEDALARYGEKVVFSNYRQQVVIKCQARVRQILDKGGSTEDAIKAGVDFVPGVITRTKTVKDPIKEIAGQVARKELTQDELMALVTSHVAELEAEENGEE
tara:strand:+ start:5180 stop:5602 length:423 start_codon:yes stop_codon:yes gene_type:complete